MVSALLPLSAFAAGGITGEIPEGLVNEGTIVTDYTGTAEELIIPDGVTVIGEYAFTDNKTLKKVVLPQSTTVLENVAFVRATALEEITMPGVTTIGDQVFRGDINLKTITMPEVVTIGENVFEKTALTKVDMPKVKTLGYRAFYNVYGDLEEVNMPIVESIGKSAFNGAGIKKISLPDTVKTIGEDAFFDNPIEYFSVSVKTFLAEDGSLAEYIFGESDLENAVIELRTDGEDVTLTPNGVTVSDKTVSFREDTFCVTDVVCESGNITNQTGSVVRVNGEEVQNNSVKPVGSDIKNDAYLSVLTMDAKYLEPVFGNLEENYKAECNYDMEVTNITAKPSDALASVTINGTAANIENNYTVTIPLTEGENIITIMVTAQDGVTTKTYTVTMQKNAKPQDIKIGTADELMAFAAAVNQGVYTGFADVTAELTNDIDMAGQEWIPIGNTDEKYFSGTFDGNGYTISNLSITHNTPGEYLGLFGATMATILDVHVTGSLHNTLSEARGSNFGVIAGLIQDGSITGCTTDFEITGENDALFGMCIGGIAGQTNGGKIENCVSKANITGQPYEAYVGGIAGAIVGTQVINCKYEGTLSLNRKGNRYMFVGGITGGAQGGSKISYCVNAGNIDTSQSDSLDMLYVGGICGQVYESSIEYCTNEGSIRAVAQYVGGIAGQVRNNSGENTLNNCLNRGTVSIKQGGNAGGIAAVISSNAGAESIQNCVSRGNITAEDAAVYHAVISNIPDGVIVQNNYYNSAIGSSGNIPEAVINGSISKSTDELNSAAFVEDMNGKGGAYRLDRDGMLEVLPKTYQLTIADSYAEVSGEGMYAEGDQIVIDAGSRSGYRFDGWAAEAGSFENAEEEQTVFTMPAKEVTVTAHWVRRSSGGGGISVTRYTVTFDTQGGSKISSKTVNWNATVSEPDEPTREGYTFEGWFIDKDCTEEYDFSARVIKNITLYAKWKEDKEPDNPTEPTDPVEPENPDEWKNPFDDVDKDDWFYDAVRYVYENGLFSGMTENTFAPNEAITRGMLVTVLWRIEEQPVANDLILFDDVDQSAYYAEAICWAASEKIVNGYSDTEFAPEQNITREEMAAIINRYADYKGVDTNVSGDLMKFADQAQIADWARENVAWAVGYGLLSGKENYLLDPQGHITRAETAAILNRFLEKNK